MARNSIQLDRNNFGAHRLLARVYTRQSTMTSGNLDKALVEKAVQEWSEIARLDPRNAEAWAFLSFFYDQIGQNDKALNALERWSRASPPLDERFYRSITGGQGLAPGNANNQLGRALLRAGRINEAINLLTGSIAESTSDNESLIALQEAIDSSAPQEAAKVIDVLQQAAESAPTNTNLLELLINAQIRAGRKEDAFNLLRNNSDKLKATDKLAAANLLAKLAAIYADEMLESKAAVVFEESLKLLEIGNLPVATDAEREFVSRVLPQLTSVYRNSGQTIKAREIIARLRSLLGNTDPSADEQLIKLLRASGESEAALQTVQDSRRRFPEDPDLLRLEAAVLTDVGRVDEAVTLLRSKIINKTRQVSVPQTLVNDFSLNLTVSTLYTQAGRGPEAIAAARQALNLSQSQQMTNIGLITLATAQNSANDFKGAEESLREVLKQEPNNATASNNLGYFLVERNERLAEAVELIKRAVMREPNNSSFLDSLGWAYFKSGQLAEAENHLTAAARRNPNSVAIQDHLGDLYERQGKLQQAKTAWRKALSLSIESNEIARIKAKVGDSRKKP
jgi:Flp pilus assembly protein TadD